jgi:hypothetical protein
MNKEILPIDIAKKMLESNDKSLVEFAIHHHPELDDLKKRINTFDDLWSVPLVRGDLEALDEVKGYLTESEVAYRKICILAKAFNKGKKPKFNGKEYYYSPYFALDSSGSQVLNDVYSWGSASVVPAPSLFLNKEDCEFVVDKFDYLYKSWIKMETFKD